MYDQIVLKGTVQDDKGMEHPTSPFRENKCSYCAPTVILLASINKSQNYNSTTDEMDHRRGFTFSLMRYNNPIISAPVVRVLCLRYQSNFQDDSHVVVFCSLYCDSSRISIYSDGKEMQRAEQTMTMETQHPMLVRESKRGPRNRQGK
jgi:hypothetical protein